MRGAGSKLQTPSRQVLCPCSGLTVTANRHCSVWLMKVTTDVTSGKSSVGGSFSEMPGLSRILSRSTEKPEAMSQICPGIRVPNASGRCFGECNMEPNSVRDSLLPTGKVLEGKDCQEGPKGPSFSLDSQSGHGVASDPEISPHAGLAGKGSAPAQVCVSAFLVWVSLSLPGAQQRTGGPGLAGPCSTTLSCHVCVQGPVLHLGAGGLKSPANPSAS